MMKAKVFNWIFYSFIFASSSSYSQVTTDPRLSYKPKSQELYNTVARLDSLLFNSYNHCDTATFASYISENIEFYHDVTGVMNSKKDLVNAIQQNICGKVTRDLVPGTLEVYEIHDYGAVEIGYHIFHNLVENSTSPPDKFVQLWHKENGRWTLTRIFSFH